MFHTALDKGNLDLNILVALDSHSRGSVQA